MKQPSFNPLARLTVFTVVRTGSLKKLLGRISLFLKGYGVCGYFIIMGNTTNLALCEVTEHYYKGNHVRFPNINMLPAPLYLITFYQ